MFDVIMRRCLVLPLLIFASSCVGPPLKGSLTASECPELCSLGCQGANSYCDRRTGTCSCTAGFTGEKCSLQVVSAVSSSNKRPAENAIDESMTTRWESEFSDPQWLRLDTGVEISFTTVDLYWQNAYGKGYDIDTSDNGKTWTITVYSETNGDGGVDDIDLTGYSGRLLHPNVR
jgi:hypothetical protein